MLQSIQLEHFKCFAALNLSLAPFTLLTGLNASGKSTVIQALTLLHQTLTESPASAALVLNGKDISLGMADDIEDTLSGRGSFTIGVEHDRQLLRGGWAQKRTVWSPRLIPSNGVEASVGNATGLKSMLLATFGI